MIELSCALLGFVLGFLACRWLCDSNEREQERINKEFHRLTDVDRSGDKPGQWY